MTTLTNSQIGAKRPRLDSFTARPAVALAKHLSRMQWQHDCQDKTRFQPPDNKELRQMLT